MSKEGGFYRGVRGGARRKAVTERKSERATWRWRPRSAGMS